MSARASNEHLALLERALGNIENDYRPTCESVNYGSGCPGPTSASIEFWRRAVDAMSSMLAELRDRRSADLSAEDVEALKDAAGHLRSRGGDVKARAARIINRIITDALARGVR